MQHLNPADPPSTAGVLDPGRDTAAPTLSIAAVERDTGLGKDTLRVWERRYGFPSPQRDALGERAYPLDQVEKLRLVRRLLDVGHRPGRILALPLDELQRLAEQTPDTLPRTADKGPDAAGLNECIELVRGHDLVGLRAALTRALTRHGVGRFVLEVVAPLIAAVGDAWVRGQLRVFEEHACTEVVQSVLRQAIAGLPEPAGDGRPRVLLTTPPGEPHGLGLLMAEAVLALEGCRCIALGTQTPPWDTVLAAAAYRADIVALGYSGCMNPNQVVDGLVEMRAKLPPAVELWAGGSAPVLVRRAVPGVLAITSLEQAPQALRRWRTTPR